MDIERNIVKAAIARTNRNLLLAAFALIAVVVIISGLGINYWTTLITGPKQLSHSELLATQSVPLLPSLVTVDTIESFDTGYEQYVYNGSQRTPTNYYIAMLIDEEYLLLVEAPPEPAELSYTGALINIPSDVRQDVLNALIDEFPDLDGVFLPVMLTTEDHTSAGWVGVLALVGTLIASIVALVQYVVRIIDVHKHPIYKKLSQYGDADTVIEEIERDRQLGVQTFDKLQVSRRWAIVSSWRDFQLMPLKDAIWMYEKVTQHRTNFIPTGKTYAVLIYNKNGQLLEVPTSRDNVNEIMTNIQRRAPWLIYGYNDQLMGMWKNKDSRMQMILEVEKRQKQPQS